MPAELPKVSAVILNLSNTPGLLECLRSLDKAAYPALEVVVVHNGPERAGFEDEVLAASSKVAAVLFTGFNSGFAAGSNAGIKRALAAGADYVLLLNDDTAVAPDFLGKLVDTFREDPGVGLAGPRIFYFSEPDRIWFSGAVFDREACSFSFPGADQPGTDYGRQATAPTDYATGCALLASRKLLETAGLLDERYFLYWEDADWGLRARAAGFKSVVVPAAKIWHKISVSSGGPDSALKTYYKTRAGLLFAERHAPAARRRLLAAAARDAAWLLFKSRAPGRAGKACACLLAVLDHFIGRHGAAPGWIQRIGREGGR